jgi:transmembrane protein TMEM260 (protein O-mannosyltransferase)
MIRRASIPAIAIAGAAFALYHATLLPGVDFGDTGSFQTIAGSWLVTPRNGYPLYFALADTVLWLTRSEPAHALNLASAIEAALACGLVVLTAAELSGSALAGAAAAMLLAVSYTFWSQAIIAEVYALHLAFVAGTVLLALRWADRPTMARLFAFFAAYALGFGNHLSMILLAPGFTLFLLLSAPAGWRSMFAPRIVAIAVACALAGALQYGWNVHTLWLLPDPPDGIVEALRRFWFDVTKTDWRDTMVLNVPRSLLSDHAAMYWFDVRQQFGVVGPVIALAGLLGLAARNWRRGTLIASLFAVNLAFAYSYNVGDAHVFYLPSHLFVALLAASAIAMTARFHRAAVPVASALLAAYAIVRGYVDFPALDRSRDTRPATVLAGLTSGLDDRRSILLADLNWQVQNGLSYFASVTRPEVAWTRMPDVLLYAPALIADNEAIGREVALTERARAEVQAAYGPLLRVDPDRRVAVPSVSEAARGLAPGTRYVVTVLRPSRDLALDRDELARLLRTLTGTSVVLPDADYAAVAGVTGQAPQLTVQSMRPFRQRLRIDQTDVQIRMDSWLASDTIRRMGFGHVIAARQHTLIVERGVSLAAFDAGGRPVRTAYSSNIFAPQPRYLVSIAR